MNIAKLSKHIYLILSIVIGILSALFVVVNARKVRLDADSGNLLSAVKRFDYLADLMPNLSFSSSIETIIWLLHRAFSFGLVELQLASSLVIIFFLLILVASIRKYSHRISVADSLVLVSLVPFIFPSIVGYASWAIVNYPLNIFVPSVLFCWTFHLAFKSTYSKEKLSYFLFCCLALLLDLRNFLPLSILFLSIYGVKVSEYKSYFYFSRNKSENNKTIVFILFYIFYLCLFTYLINSQLHKEALAPRKAIQWNYFGHDDNSLFQYIFENTLSLFQSTFFSKDIIADKVTVVIPKVILVMCLVCIAAFKSITVGSKALKVLSIYCFLCILSVLILGVSGVYAYGNIRYQLWLFYPLYIFAILGAVHFLESILILNLNRFNIKGPIKLVILVALTPLLAKQVYLEHVQSNVELESFKDVGSLLRGNKEFLLADYVVIQKASVLGFEVDSKKSLIIDRNWLKNEGLANFSLDLLDDKISRLRMFMFVSSWPQTRAHVVQVVNKIKARGFICSTQASIEQLYIYTCINKDKALLPFPSFGFIDNVSEYQNSVTLSPGGDVLFYRHLAVEPGTRACQPMALDFKRKENVNLKIQLWRHGNTPSEGASLNVNGAKKRFATTICHTFKHRHSLVRMYIKNQGKKSIDLSLFLDSEI